MADRRDEFVLHAVERITLADVSKAQHRAGEPSLIQNRIKKELRRESSSIAAEDRAFASYRFPLARRAPQRAVVCALLVRRGRAMHKLMNRLANQVLRTRTQQPGRRGIRKTHQPIPIDSADSVSHRPKQNLLLPAQLFGALPLPRSGQHLRQRSGHCFHRRGGFPIFANPRVAIELQYRQHVIANLHRSRPALKSSCCAAPSAPAALW